MNRCSSHPHTRFKRRLLIGALWLISTSLYAQTDAATAPLPQRIPPISVNAQFGVLNIVQPPDVLLDGQAARLAPGARIRGTNNLLVMSGAITGQDLPVRYTIDSYGLIFNVWILSDAEIARDPLAPKRPDMPPSD